MKKIVIDTSATGNTEKVGLAIANELGCEAVKFTEDLHLNLDGYDFIALGFYVDKGDAEPKFKRFLREIKGKKTGVFMTLGMDPEHEHAMNCLEKAKVVLREGENEILREFYCQGAIDPKVIEQLRKMGEAAPNDPRYAVTPEREARWARAATHPDANDLENAKAAFRGI